MASSKFLQGLAPLDDVDTDCRPIIDIWHHKCHEGEVYAWNYTNLAAASSTTIYIHVKTGAKQVHIDTEFMVLGGHLQVQWYGSPTMGTAGTALNCPNRNRNYKDVSALTTIYTGSTVSTVGSVLFGTRTALGNASTQSKVGSAIVGEAERILLANTNYLIGVTPVGVVSLTVDGIFYEVTP